MLLFVTLSTVLILFIVFVTGLIFRIVRRCTYGFCTITLDSVLLCYVFCMLQCNNGILLMTTTGYVGMMYVTLQPTVTDLLENNLLLHVFGIIIK